MSETTIDRTRKSSNDETERFTRERDVQGLLHDLLGRHQEFFSDPENRLDFIQEQDAASFYHIAQHINAKLRGEKPHEVRGRDEKGAFLPMLHTPSQEDKPAAFRRGFDALQEYLQTSQDSLEKKLEGAAMATEALLIWVHPFNDGNGRTSRFLAKFIEQGGASPEELIAESASSRERRTLYDYKVITRESKIALADNEEIISLDDNERDELRKQAETSPNDVEGMYLSIKQLLENDYLREKAKRLQKKQELAA